ncbi:MAG: hypothetical protein LAP38_13535 [Acidobacteriia bacterium]|nr:hypothetical protein [Terriglobia bacterium]
MRASVIILCVLGCAFTIGCGSVGEPLYPAVNIPTAITDLKAVERGNRIDVTFTIPATTTEGLVLKTVGSVELRVGPNAGPEFQIDRWASTATRADVTPTPSTGPVRVPVAAQQFVGQDVIVAVRLTNAKGRYSGWSNLVPLTVDQPLATPANVKAEAVPRGVAVAWTAAGTNQFRVYRKTGDEKEPSLLATVEQPTYLDAATEYGKAYEYYVEAVRGKTVSEVAGPVAITPKDIFPPAVPAGLTASAGIGSVELAWERNTEPDFKEYRISRSEEAGQFVQIAAGLEAPSYSDRNVESGKHYRYRIVAVDQSGNASEPCNPVEAIAP